MNRSKQGASSPLSLDEAIIAHRKVIKEILSHMQPTGRGSSMVWVPQGYDLRTTAEAPLLKKKRTGNGAEAAYYLDMDKAEYRAVVKEANIAGRTYYQLSDGQIVKATYCCKDGDQHKPLPGIKKK